MTLVLAIRCRDGVVLASDGQATTDAAGQPTRQPMRKLFSIGGRIAWGAAGSVGLQQTLAGELARREDELLSAPDPREALARIVIPVQQRAVADFVALPGAAAPELACIFCWADGPAGRPAIMSVPRTGSDHQLHGRYSAVGTGDIFAEYAMASVAHLGTDRLDLEQAKMVAYKAVSDAISVAAVYLGPPIQMAVVTPSGGACEVAREDLDGGLSDSVDAWKARQRESLGALGPPPEVPSLLSLMQSMKESA